VANYYNKLAKAQNKIVPAKYDLAGLPLDSPEGQEYFAAMTFCLRFAESNRDLIASRFLKVFASVTGVQRVKQVVKIHHNYASVETHFGEEVIVHRKGANSAQKGQLGIIPGSMGTPSYIVEGLGNPESFMSCSHGCGRVMSRKEANRILDEKRANESMRGIFFTGWKGDYSEAPAAYKDIETVLANQSDLVKPLVKLQPLGVMKG
jgi:tRNA-splicing ligase RtcB